MRKYIIIFGSILGVVILGVGGAFYWVSTRGQQLDEESRKFVDVTVPLIATRWNAEQLLFRATPQLRATAKVEELKKLLDPLRGLGPMTKYDPSTGEANMIWSGFNETITAHYSARARFQYGNATFQVGLRRLDKRWLVDTLKIDVLPDKDPVSGS